MTLTRLIAGLLFAGAHLMVRAGPGFREDNTLSWGDLVDAEHDLYLLNIGEDR